VAVSQTSLGAPVYLRDLVDIARGYDSPPRFLNFTNRATHRAIGSAPAPSRSPFKCDRENTSVNSVRESTQR